MSSDHSPRFNGDTDNMYDPNFTLNLNRKMRVPKNIRLSDDYTEDDIIDRNDTVWDQVTATDKFDMHVPDRILVDVQDQHIFTKAQPREITLENAAMSPEPANILVQTPPRVLTLNDHYFPAVDEEEPSSYSNEIRETVIAKPHIQPQIDRRDREQTPSYFTVSDVSLPPSEEIKHLRRQVSKLNRRVLSIEIEMSQRQQRDKIFYTVTLTYLLLKAILWLNRK